MRRVGFGYRTTGIATHRRQSCGFLHCGHSRGWV